MEYQRKKQTKYILPRTVYHQTLWRIRDYYRLKELADNLIECKSGEIDGMPKATGISDKVGNAVVKRERFISDVSCINIELKQLSKTTRLTS